MRWTYSCPHCHSMLNPDETIILLGSSGGQRMLVGFHPKPGNYELYLPPGVKLEEGTTWSFWCPVCQSNLQTSFAENLCAIDIDTEAESHRVFFSRIAGEHATFVAVSEGLREKHGPDSAKLRHGCAANEIAAVRAVAIYKFGSVSVAPTQ